MSREGRGGEERRGKQLKLMNDWSQSELPVHVEISPISLGAKSTYYTLKQSLLI